MWRTVRKITIALLAISVCIWGIFRYSVQTRAFLRSIFDLLPDLAGFFLAALGVGLLFVPEKLKQLDDYPKTRLVLAIVICLMGGGAVISNSLQKSEEKNAALVERDKLTGQVTKLIDQQILARTEVESLQGQVKTITEERIPQILGGVQDLAKPRLAPRPDLHFRLVYPKSVAVRIENDSKGGVADKPKYQITLADLDNIEGNLLPIPVQEGDFIRPGEAWGPNLAMELPAVKAIVKPGDRVFGYALVLCPECVKTRSYWIYIEQGKGGWYAEMTKPQFPKGLQFWVEMKKDVDAVLEELAPSASRISITEP